MFAVASSRPEDPLVGRDAEIARIAAVLQTLAGGRGSVLEISGDPGVGKTSLLVALAKQAGQLGIPVARSIAVAADPRPYRLFRDVWADSPMMPEFTSADEGFADGFRDRLARWAAAGGGVLVLDDLHLCDEASADLVAQLVRTPVPGPFVLALAHQPRRGAPALLGALDHGARTGRVVRIEPEPLEERDVEVLLGRWRPVGQARVPHGFAARMRAACGGNPRNLRILAAAGWRPDAWPDSPGSDPGRLLREAVAMTAELDGLPAEQTAAATVGAVLGDPFRPKDVAEVSGLGLERTVDALASLARGDVVRAADGGGRFAFRDPVLRHVVLERSDFGVRLSSHRRALEVLAARGAAAPVLARHAQHVVSADGAAGLRPLVDGALAIVGRDPATAARWLRIALESHYGERRDREWARLALVRCHALTAVGEVAQARDLAYEVLAVGHVLTPELRLRAHACCADIERRLGRYPEAEAVVHGGLALLPRPLPDPPSAAALELVFQHGMTHAWRGDFAGAHALVREAVRGPGEDGGARETETGRGSEIAVLALAAFTGSVQGRMEQAASEAARCALAVDALPDAMIDYAPETLALLGCSELHLERFPDALRHLRRGLAASGGGAHRHVRMFQLLGLAVHDERTGRLERAQRRAEEAQRLARELGAPDAEGLAMILRAAARLWTLGRRGNAEVLALAQEGVRTLPPGRGWWAGLAIGLLAQTQLVCAEATACRSTLTGGLDGPLAPVPYPPCRPALLALLSAAALKTGDPADAREQVRAAQEAADALGLPAQQAYVSRARAAVHAVDGEHDLAAASFGAAAEAFRRAEMPVQHAWTLVCGVRSTAAALGRQAALDQLGTAVSIARFRGAQRIQEEALRARKALPAGGAARDVDSPADDAARQLSEREREIAELAAAGMRSRQIADQLFLSPRTVDTHLSRIYRKLDIPSRAALSRVIGPERVPANS